MRNRLICTALGYLLAGSMYGAVTEEHPFSVHDMWAMKRVGDPQASPDGESVILTLRIYDVEGDSRSTDLYLVSREGGEARQLTTHPASDFNPRWAPAKRWIYFLSTRSGSSQVWRISPDGGEAEQVTDLPLGISNLEVSPSGDRLVFSLEVFPDCDSIECTEKRLREEKERKSSGILYDRLFIRHWDTWKDGRRSHLFAYLIASGELRDLMSGFDADSPSKPFGGSEEFAISPDGKTLIFTARNTGREEPWSTDFDLYEVPLDRSRKPACITEENPAWDTGPVFSPDGRTLAYLAMKRAGFEADRFRILLKDLQSGDVRVLTEDWDRSPGSLTWSADGKTLYATAAHLGQRALFAVDTESGSVEIVVGEGTVSSPQVFGDRILFGRDDLNHPAELYSVRPDGGDMRTITHFNRELLDRIRMGEAEQFTFPGWNDEKVYGYVVKPVDFNPDGKYPVAFLIHGGPQGSFGNHFHYRWNPQVYAGAGYAVVMVDFHGSVGYGQEFTDSISGDWGGKPLVDLQKGLAASLQRYLWMDGDRVGALGASYGGYMINWIAGNWPDRFRCLVNHDGTFDQRTMYYATEELWFPEWEHGGPYWKNPEGHEKHNPARFVQNWKTPMLVIHGALDFRIPVEQGIAAFTALQRKGIPSRFLYFPDENHWVLSPHNGILWHETVIGWLDRWLK